MQLERKSHYETNWRWYVLGTLYLATFICYFSRQVLGTAIDPIAEEFHLDNIQIGELLSAFLIAYAISHLFIGLVVDRIRNLGLFYTVMVVGWSLSTLLVAFAEDFKTLVILRYLLGVFESINFPICLMIISRIFPPNERSLAVGIFASGAFLATISAPPFVVYLSNIYDWRYAFAISGGFSIFWIVPWLIIFRKPQNYVPDWESYYDAKQKMPFRDLLLDLSKDYIKILKLPGFWAVVLLGIGITPSLYFMTQWLPRFLTQSLGVTYDSSLSWKLTMIYLMQDIGLWLGGLIILLLSRKMFSVFISRKIVLLSSLIFMPIIAFIPQFSSVGFIIFILCVYVFCLGGALGNQHAFKQDIAKGKVAAVASLVGFIEMTFTWWFIKQIGTITNNSGDFSSVFYIMTAFSFLAILVSLFLIKPKWIKIS